MDWKAPVVQEAWLETVRMSFWNGWWAGGGLCWGGDGNVNLYMFICQAMLFNASRCFHDTEVLWTTKKSALNILIYWLVETTYKSNYYIVNTLQIINVLLCATLLKKLNYKKRLLRKYKQFHSIVLYVCIVCRLPKNKHTHNAKSYESIWII